MYEKILVPFDGSPTSEQALKEAAGLALKLGAQVRLLHIIDPLTHAVGFVRPEVYRSDFLPAAMKGAETMLRKACDQLTAQGIQAETRLLENLDAQVATLVIDEARQWGAGLIVLGTQGRRGLTRMFLGSDAEQIARTAPVPVLLVRLPAQAQPAASA
ncbi:universal stress protein [Acidovorax carolinensis]|jgi:nucleotide-binding universal stress UspA family protein|uniref:universal stress protein n=1 Tax=Acidovorax carolinensis TaxID=553814 RepID=UPI000B347AE2|nr:universal stress protein [Acidovorax carolinensis]ART49677.1 universal stress protein UspA [Acidovorax carolinensis]